MSYDVVRKLIRTVGGILALTIGLVVPAAFGMLDYVSLVGATRAEADFHAQYLGRLVESGNFRYSAEGLQGTIAAIAATSETTAHVRLVDENGTPLLEWGPSLSGNLVKARSVVTLAGEPVGYVEVENNVASVLDSLIFLSLIGCALGGLAYLAMTKLPAQALDDASRQIAEHQHRLADKNAQLDAALTNMVQGVCLYDADQRIMVANRRYAEIYGLDERILAPGTSLRQVLEARVRNNVYTEYEAREMVELGIAKFGEHVSEIIVLQDGRHISVLRRPLPNGGLITTHEDVTDRKKADAQIAHMAKHDTLTGLPNRLFLRERLERATRCVGEGHALAVHCLDLDRFKTVNDTLGHPMGDALLCEVSARLQACIRGTDSVARLGGDEFAVVQAGIADPGQAAALAERLIAVLSEPFEINGHRIVIGASVGIAVATLQGADGELLLKNADLALYCSKSEGRGRYRFFEAEMDARIQARRVLEFDLSNALALEQFELYYQPLVDLKSNRVVAMEALLRWRHPVRGFISPMEFIPIAEEIGMIESIGLWVLRQACLEAAKWPDEVGVSVNLSPHQFKSGTLAFDVAAALATSGLPASRLELEITESALMQNTETTLATLAKIRDLGVKVAMDDFGTGYSSLSYLHAFPFDKIKIDKCFVQNLSDKPDSGHILRAVVGLGTSLRMITTAEGVETEAQLLQLREEGCTQVQGYYFSPPRPADEVDALLARINAGGVGTRAA
ncbi:MAG: EAL domain-containing protein [Hyphomicrobiaceae bacterium]|nr:EAL domain-containing protein [Hyphomicrobiaceae bacterium]